MKLFLDTINISEIEQFSELIIGITTNPIIISKFLQNRPYKLAIDEMKMINERFPHLLINVQVRAKLAKDIILEALEITALGENFIAKIPLSIEGLKAIHQLQSQKIRINGTACFSVLQARLAQEYGAEFISPFIGRMQANGQNIEAFMQNLSTTMINTQILAASIRTIEHLELAASYANYVTVTAGLLNEFFEIPLLKIALEQFDKA